MTDKDRFNVLTWRWSAITAIIIALFWAAWRLATGSVPAVLSVKMSETITKTVEIWTIGFGFSMSRLWDVLIGPIFSAIIIQSLRFFDNEKTETMVFGLVVGLIFGFVFGLPLCLTSGLILCLEAYLVFGLIFSLAFRMIFCLELSLIFGMSFGLGFSLSIGLARGLAVYLAFNLAYGLIYGSLFLLLYGLFCGLVYGLKRVNWSMVKGWLLAKG